MSKALVLLGPTAVGKSKLAIELAKKIDAEIISADSMQVYRGMDLGTAKPAKKDQQQIPHHLIDVRNPDEPWTVSDFIEQTNKLTAEIIKRGKTPIIAGGTGLYLWSLLKGYSFPMAQVNKEIRSRLEKEGLSILYSRLRKVDPAAAAKINPNDKKRIIRALEVYELTGKQISKLQEHGTRNTPRQSSGQAEHPSTELGASRTQEYIFIGLTLPRDQLYQRIEQRVDQMIAHGLIEEVKTLLAKGYSKNLPSFQALGYKEVVEFLEGKWTKEQMIAELKKRTRNFARRQMTWFKRFEKVRWFEVPVDLAAVLDYINSI